MAISVHTATDYQTYMTLRRPSHARDACSHERSLVDLVVDLDWLSTWFHACCSRCGASALVDLSSEDLGDHTARIKFDIAAISLAQSNNIQSVHIRSSIRADRL